MSVYTLYVPSSSVCQLSHALMLHQVDSAACIIQSLDQNRQNHYPDDIATVLSVIHVQVKQILYCICICLRMLIHINMMYIAIIIEDQPFSAQLNFLYPSFSICYYFVLSFKHVIFYCIEFNIGVLYFA